MTQDRLSDLKQFYRLIDRAISKVNGAYFLSECHGRMDWPQRGVYFFFETGEERAQSGTGLRVVRVGTHAVSTGSRTKLWDRLRQHKGCAVHGGGNHRGSVFRKVIGSALLARDPELHCVSWGIGANAPREVRNAEHDMERIVSHHIQSMPFVWLRVDDEPDPNSMRAYIERNSIALLSNWGRHGEGIIDPPTGGWLGRSCPCERVRDSGLWNSNHVSEDYDPGFLSVLESCI